MVNTSPFSRQTRTTTGWWAKPRIVCVGIASSEIFGMAILSPHIHPEGIASAEVFGDMVFEYMQELVPAGIASVEAFGIPELGLGAGPTSIASAEAFGTPTVSYEAIATGIPTAEAFGTAQITTGTVDIAVTSIPSAEAFGTTPVVVNEIAPQGISNDLISVDEGSMEYQPWWMTSVSPFSFDTAQFHSGTRSLKVSGAGTTVSLNNVPATAGAKYMISLWARRDSAFNGGVNCKLRIARGDTNVIITSRDFMASSLPAADTWYQFFYLTPIIPVDCSTVRITYTGDQTAGNVWVDDVTVTLVDIGTAAISVGPVSVSVPSIASTEAFGSTDVAPEAAYVTLTSGIPTAEAIGALALSVGSVDLAPTSIASTEALGTQVITRGDVDISPSGIASTEAFGTLAITTGSVDVSTVGAIASAEAFGTAEITTGTVDIAVTGIPSAEAFGTTSVANFEQYISPTSIASAEAFGTAVISTAATLSYSSVSAGSATASGTSISWTHTIATDENLILVEVGVLQNVEAAMTATFDGNAMTKVAYGYRCVVFKYAVPLGTSGAKSINVNAGSTVQMSGLSTTFKNAIVSSSVVNPAYSANDGGSHTATATATASGMLCYAIGQAYGSTQPSATNFTMRGWRNDSNTSVGVGTQPGSGSAITMSCSTGQWGSSIAVVLAPS